MIIFDHINCILNNIFIFLFEFPYRFFWHIGVQDVDISIVDDVEAIKGTQKLHSIKTKLSTNVFALDKRNILVFVMFA